jgi:hypothetical protein
MPTTFRTEDGCLLYLTPRGDWADSLDPDSADMRFESGADGLPIDVFGDPLPGVLVVDGGDE